MPGPSPLPPCLAPFLPLWEPVAVRASESECVRVSPPCIYPQSPAELLGTSPGGSRTHVTDVGGGRSGAHLCHGQLSLGVGGVWAASLIFESFEYFSPQTCPLGEGRSEEERTRVSQHSL